MYCTTIIAFTVLCYTIIDYATLFSYLTYDYYSVTHILLLIMLYRKQQVYHTCAGAEQVPQGVRGDGRGHRGRPLGQRACLGRGTTAQGLGHPLWVKFHAVCGLSWGELYAAAMIPFVMLPEVYYYYLYVHVCISIL